MLEILDGSTCPDNLLYTYGRPPDSHPRGFPMIHLSKSSRISPHTTLAVFATGAVVVSLTVSRSGAAYPIAVSRAVNGVLRRIPQASQALITALVIASGTLLSDGRDTQLQSPLWQAIVIRHSPPQVRLFFGRFVRCFSKASLKATGDRGFSRMPGSITAAQSLTVFDEPTDRTAEHYPDRPAGVKRRLEIPRRRRPWQYGGRRTWVR
jgi:hypothetical protein